MLKGPILAVRRCEENGHPRPKSTLIGSWRCVVPAGPCSPNCMVPQLRLIPVELQSYTRMVFITKKESDLVRFMRRQ